MSIGSEMLVYRKEHDLTQQELAEMIHIDPSVISKIEKGKRELPPGYDAIVSNLDWKLALELIDVRTDGFISNILRHVPNLDLHPAALKDLLQKELSELDEALEGLVTAKHIDPEKRKKGAERVWQEMRDVIEKAIVMQGVLEEEFGLDRKQLMKQHEQQIKNEER